MAPPASAIRLDVSHRRAEANLRLEDLRDRVDVSARRSRRRLTWAVAASVLAPASFLFEPLLAWTGGWRPFNLLSVGVVLLLAGSGWRRWRDTANETARLKGTLLTSEHIVRASPQA